MVLKISLDEGRAALERWPYARHFPVSPAPASQQEWDDLVSMFLTYSRRTVRQAKDELRLSALEPGYSDTTWRDGLEFLAVHTAYHLGKVVGLRQVLHLWPK